MSITPQYSLMGTGYHMDGSGIPASDRVFTCEHREKLPVKRSPTSSRYRSLWYSAKGTYTVDRIMAP